MSACALLIITFIVICTFIILNQGEKLLQVSAEDTRTIIPQLVASIQPMFDARSDPFTGMLEPLNRRDILREIRFFAYTGKRSYVVDKVHVYLKVRSNRTGEVYAHNKLVYVLLHEIAHCICDEVNLEDPHTPYFARIFKELGARAIQYGILDKNRPYHLNYDEED